MRLEFHECVILSFVYIYSYRNEDIFTQYFLTVKSDSKLTVFAGPELIFGGYFFLTSSGKYDLMNNMLLPDVWHLTIFDKSLEAVTGGVLQRKMFLKILQYSQENTRLGL